MPTSKEMTDSIIETIRAHREHTQKRMFSGSEDDKHVDGELLSAAMVYVDLAKHQIRSRSPEPFGIYKDYNFKGDVRVRAPYVPPGGTDHGYKIGREQLNCPPEWPFMKNHYNPATPRYNLIRAASLIVSELERLERADRKAIEEIFPKKPKKNKDDPYADGSEHTTWGGLAGQPWLSQYASPTQSVTLNANAVLSNYQGATTLVSASSPQLLSTGTI